MTAALAASALSCSCSSSTTDGPTATVDPTPSTTTRPDRPPTTSTTSTTKPPTPEDKVKAAFLKAIATSMKVAEKPNPNDPRLAETRSGPSLDRLREIMSGYVAEGVHVEYVDGKAPVPMVEKVELQAETKALVTFCLVDNARQVRTSDGKTVNSGVRSQRNRAEMLYTRGAWRINAQAAVAAWVDGKGCDR